MVRQAFADRGAIAVDDPASADLAVLNSCTVTATGEAKLRGLARRLARARVETVVITPPNLSLEREGIFRTAVFIKTLSL